MSAIIFDMDGTLFQTNLILEPALQATFEELRRKKLWDKNTPIEAYRRIMGVPLPVVWETLCPEHSLEIRNESNRVFHRQLVEQIRTHKGDLYEGVEETLVQLSDSFPLFIASNGEMEYLEQIVDTYKLDRYIKGTYSIQQIPSGNKSELVERLRIENQIDQGYVVGDRMSDFKAARDNGLTSIGVNFDFAQESELIYADYTVDCFRSILTIILE